MMEHFKNRMIWTGHVSVEPHAGIRWVWMGDCADMYDFTDELVEG
jgi:hypothetical protein